MLRALRRISPGISSIGTDFSGAALRQAGSATVCLADARALPFPDNTFDVVTACEVLEHIQEFDAALREIKRVCREGGAIIVSVPNFVGFSHRVSMLLGLYPDRWEHLHAFTYEKLRKDLKVHGLEVCSLQGDFLRIPVLLPMPSLGLRRKINWRLCLGARLFPRLSAHIVAVCRKSPSTPGAE